MAETDTSSYGKPITSPFETLGALTNIQNASNQNKLFQQQYQTNLGVGQAYKTAIRPDGTIDQAALNQLIQSNPNVAVGLPQIYQGAQEAQKRQQDIQSQQIDVARKNVDTLGSYISPLAALGPKATVGDVMGAAAKAITAGHVDPKVISQVLSDLPADDSAVPGWLQQQQIRFMSIKDQFNAMHPSPTMVNNGQQQIPVRLPQIGNPSVAGPGIQNQLPPTTPTFNQATKQPGYLGSTGAGAAAGGGSGPPGGFIASGPALGAGAAADVDATAGANQGVALQSRSDQVPTNKALLGNLGTALDQFTSGPGQDWKALAKKFANANSPFGAIFDPKSIASQEEFTKQATQLAQSQFQQLGGTGANAQLESAMHTSPNTELSKMGNHSIIALLKGNEDAIAIKNQAWQQYKQQNGPQSYGQFSTKFNQSYDPRVFQGQYLSPDDRQKMVTEMNASEKKSFANSLRIAIANGWIKPNGQ